MAYPRLRARMNARMTGATEEERRALVASLQPLLGTALPEQGPDAWLTTREVAMLFRVSTATIRRWADAGKLATYRSLGGHRMFPLSTVRRALDRFTRPDGGRKT